MTFTLPREAARRFRAIARKCLPARIKSPDPPVLVTATNGTFTLCVHFTEVILVLDVPSTTSSSGSILVPMEVLDEAIVGKDDLIHLNNPSRQVRDETPPEVPDLPEQWSDVPSEFLAALHEAGRTAAREAGKYAVTRVQVQGASGRVIGTDGKQALLIGGFTLPFAENVLVPAIPAFGAKELQSETPVTVGKTATHLAVRVGPWTVWLALDVEARFPDAAGAIPRARLSTTLELRESDADQVVAALRRLPGGDEINGPVLLEIGQRITVRAQGEHDSVPTDEILGDSSVSGPPVTVGLNRTHLARAMRLGFRKIRFAGADRPWVAEDDSRTYLSATLDARYILKSTPSNQRSPLAPKLENRMPVHPSANGHTPEAESAEPDSLEEAEALRAALSEAHIRAGKLIAALRGYRKQHKTVASALASLRALRLE